MRPGHNDVSQRIGYAAATLFALERAATLDTRSNDHETMMQGDAETVQFPNEAL